MLSLKKLTFLGEKSLFVGRGLRKSIFTPSHQGIILKIILKRWNDNIYLKIALIQPAVYGLYKSSTHFWHLDFNNIVISIQYIRYSAVLYHFLSFFCAFNKSTQYEMKKCDQDWEICGLCQRILTQLERKGSLNLQLNKDLLTLEVIFSQKFLASHVL